ncbi:hypothetical protein Lser_V15G22269 [Lactuca serriola]
MENLSFICGGLGIIEEDDDANQIGYTPGEYCLDNLKDLLRFLRRDDPETREVFKQVCKWNIVGKDILPIIQHRQNDTTLLLNAVKVLVFLTMPIDPTSKDIPQQIEYLWGLKSMITSSHAIPVIVTLLESPLEHLEGDSFTEDDWKLVQLVVTLFRNILAVQDITTQQRVAGLASEFVLLRDRFLELLFEENVMDLILVLTQHVGGSSGVFRQDNLLLLETFYYIYKCQVPELIARAHVDASMKVEGEAEATATDLKSLMEEEKEKRRQTMLLNIGARSKFSGSFTRVTMDGSKVLVKGNPCSDSHDSLLKGHKNQRDSSKKMPWESGRMPTTNKNILRLLHDFTNQFLLGGYNVLMQSIREDIEKEHHAIENSDVVIFFQVAEFIMSFQNHKLLASKPDAEVNVSESSKDHDAESTLFEGNICGSISETMNEPMFLLVVSKWRSAFDGLKETNDYKFLSAAGSLMKIMINMLDLVLKMSPDDSREPQTARVLLYKLFYDQTDQGMTYFLFNLIKTFNAHKQPKSDLADLVETIHIVIRLMENLQSRGTLRVSKKSRRKRKKKPSTTNKDANTADQIPIQNNDLVHDDEQTENVSIPEKETSPSSKADKIGDDDDDIIRGESDATKEETKDTEGNNDYVLDESSDDDDEEEQDARNEVDFKASSLVSSLANNTIIQNLCWLLKFYKSNSVRTNHYIISALTRICQDLELSPMLYQLSLLMIFHTILEEQKSSPLKEHKNIVLFLTDLIRRMLRKMKSNPLLFVEILFWKSRKECHYINCESMLQDFGRNGYTKRGNDNNTHNGNDNDNVGGNGYGYGYVKKSMADALGDDEADVVIPPWRDTDRGDDQSEENGEEGTENFIERTETVENPVKPRKRLKPLVLNDELEEKLKDLFEKYKELPDCSQRIVTELNLEVSSAQVSKKLKELGLKFPPKKRMINKDVSDIQEKDMDASLQQPSFVRKRVRAFNEDQEMKIRALFEQFKDHKKCSHMIASALEGDVAFTAAQITRKLTQLGLRVKKQKSNDKMNLRDDDDVSDGETLLSLKKRSKNKVSIEKTQDNISDDDNVVLSASFKRKKKQNIVTNEATPDGNNNQLLDDDVDDDDDDVVLSSAFRSKKKHTKVTTEETPNDDDDDVKVVKKRLSHKRGNLVNDKNSEEEVVNGEEEDVMMTESVNHMDDELVDDEVMDLGNNESPVMSQKSGGVRRKLRMIIDDED